jgi:hypothetical protein
MCRDFALEPLVEIPPRHHQGGTVGLLRHLFRRNKDVRVDVERGRDLPLPDPVSDLTGRDPCPCQSEIRLWRRSCGWKCGIPATRQAFAIILCAAWRGCWTRCSHGRAIARVSDHPAEPDRGGSPSARSAPAPSAPSVLRVGPSRSRAARGCATSRYRRRPHVHWAGSPRRAPVCSMNAKASRRSFGMCSRMASTCVSLGGVGTSRSVRGRRTE